MKRCILGAFALLVLALALPASGVQPKAPADGLKLANTKQPVIFNHSTHEKDMKCDGCHHAVEGKENFGKCSNAGCHDVMERKEQGVKGYYRAMHAKKDTKFSTCNSCHAQQAEKFTDKKKELTACKQSKCHP